MTTPTDTIKITAEKTVVAPKRVRASLKILNIPKQSFEPKRSEIDITTLNANTHPKSSKSDGKTVKTTVTIPNIPTVLLIRERLETRAEYVSLTAPPTTGTVLPTTKRIPLEVKESTPAPITPFNVTTPEKKVQIKPKKVM